MDDLNSLIKIIQEINIGGNDLNDTFEVEEDKTIRKGTGYHLPENDKCCDNSKKQKIRQRKLNTNMSKQSMFDNIYKKVLKENFGVNEDDDLQALGLDDATPDSEMDDEFGGEEEGDTVTVTLDKATAQALIDVLQGALGGDEEEGFGDEEGGDEDLDFGDDEGGDFGGEPEEDSEEEDADEDECDVEEDEETTTGKKAPDKKNVNQGPKKSNVAKTGVKPKGKKKANTKLTDGISTGDNANLKYDGHKDMKVKGFPGVGDFFK